MEVKFQTPPSNVPRKKLKSKEIAQIFHCFDLNLLINRNSIHTDTHELTIRLTESLSLKNKYSIHFRNKRHHFNIFNYKKSTFANVNKEFL